MGSRPDDIDAARKARGDDDASPAGDRPGTPAVGDPRREADDLTGDATGDFPDDQLDVQTATVTGDHAALSEDDLPLPAPFAASAGQVVFGSLTDRAHHDLNEQDLATMSLAPTSLPPTRLPGDVGAPAGSSTDSPDAPRVVHETRDERSAVTPAAPRGKSAGAHADGPAGASHFDSAEFEALSREASASAAHVIRIEDGSYAIASSEDAMWQNELGRYQFVINVVLSIVVLGTVTLPFMGGSATIKSILFALMALLAIECVWQRRRLRTPERVTRNGIIVTWLLTALTTCTAVAYFGIFSEANVMLALEFLLIGMTGHRLLIGLFMGVTFLFVAVVGTLLCAGIAADPGLIHASYLDGTNQVLALLLTQSVMIASVLLGLSTRREIVATFDKLQRAAQLVERQRAMVREVRQDLKRAANIGGRGPLTGHIIGSFRLGVLIGRGGMGEVYQAAHTETHELAAVKVLQASAMAERGAKRRFAREIEVAASLTMAHVVRVLEVGGQDSVPYLAMEYLRGQDLARYLRKRGHLALDKVVKLTREVGAGIHAAGQAGIVHRDIKPHNLFLAEISDPEARRRRRIWKILDFGVATAKSHTGTLTQGHIVGTPAYMAPEQARGLTVTHAADLYALASIVYRSLTGHPPYSGDDLPSLLYRVVHEMPRRPSRLADIPEAFDTVLAVGMAKEPDARFQSADELADAVAEAAHGRVSEALQERAAALADEHPWR